MEYKKFTNWMLKHELDRLINLHQSMIVVYKYLSNKNDIEKGEKEKERVLEEISLICDEMNIRGI